MGVLTFLNKKDKHYCHTHNIDINLYLTNSGDNSEAIKTYLQTTLVSLLIKE